MELTWAKQFVSLLSILSSLPLSPKAFLDTLDPLERAEHGWHWTRVIEGMPIKG